MYVPFYVFRQELISCQMRLVSNLDTTHFIFVIRIYLTLDSYVNPDYLTLGRTH